MSKKIKGLLILVVSLICSLCVVACNPSTSESQSESSTHVCQFTNWETSKDATCEEDGEEIAYCECGESSVRSIPSLGHDLKDGEVITPSTCDKHGKREVNCSVCEYKGQVDPIHSAIMKTLKRSCFTTALPL